MMNRRVRHLNPVHMGATLALDARFLKGYADGANVTTWTGRNGSVDAVEVPGETEPSYKQNGMNNIESMHYDSTSDMLYATVSYVRGTFISAAQLDNTSSQYSRLITLYKTGVLDYESNTNFIPAVKLDSEALYSYQNYTSYNNISISYNTPFMWSTNYSNSKITNYKNSSTVANTNGSFSNLQADRVGVGSMIEYHGNNASWKGYIGAMVCCPTVLSDAGRRRLEQALAFSFKIRIG